MRKLLTLASLLLAVAFLLLPSSALAYSYGDPNKEDVAETFKAVIAAAAGGDWNTAAETHKVRRAEIVSHFGEEVAAELDRNLEDKNEAELMANYKALMVMNLERRFDSAKEMIADYTQAKMLLAKGRATFDALKPYLEAKLSPAEIASLEERFEAALKAIGNPGLFGVGKAEADPKLLADNVDAIYAAVAPHFPYKGKTPDAPGTHTGKPGAGGTPAPEEHAPMARENRTNAGVTFGVIGGVVALGALGVWWARRKGIL